MVSLYLLKIIGIITIVISGETNGARILGLFPLNGKSHFIMCEQLMKALAKKGHQVDVISHFPLKKPFPNYKDFSLEGSLPNVQNNVTYEELQKFAAFNLKHFTDKAGIEICKLMKHPVINNIIKNPPNDPPYDVVILEIFAANCYFAIGRHLRVPIIGVSTTPLLGWFNDPIGNPVNPAIMPELFSGLPQKMNFWQRLQNTLMSYIVKQQFNYYATKQKQYVDEHFGPGYPSVYELSTEMSLILANIHYSLNGVQPLTPAVIEVGGMHIEDSGEKLIPELQSWLDESKHGCVYVSFGSMVKIESFPRETLKAFYATFKNLAPVRVLMKISEPKDLLPGLPENVKTYHWLPQIQILKHKNVKVFVTHGGLMGTLESIYAGVAMVGIPLFGDQFLNIGSYQKKRIAVSLDYRNITETALTEAINTVLNDPAYRNNIERVSKLYYDRLMNPKDTAVFWTEYVIRHGNVLRSPAIDLKWYQVHLLDVYGFLFFITLLIFCIILFILRTLVRCVYCKKKIEKSFSSKKQK
ncbi:UDP-glucuronosyltransferase 2B31-like [Belonocnema kinseyi]|uniref:UDP-glucuronosyltransferase 2B31-like n=1 Tax=Belonocnema kinseyi TaxID=2817044 RepID=UPI00143E02D5|nr:UDP-glucuronosyltransferase 2B31-like [Belonocnema kinseyi]